VKSADSLYAYMSALLMVLKSFGFGFLNNKQAYLFVSNTDIGVGGTVALE